MNFNRRKKGLIKIETEKRYSNYPIVNKIKSWWQDESGMGVVEVVLIIIVLIGLVILFKDNITALVESLFETVVDDAGTLQ